MFLGHKGSITVIFISKRFETYNVLACGGNVRGKLWLYVWKTEFDHQHERQSPKPPDLLKSHHYLELILKNICNCILSGKPCRLTLKKRGLEQQSEDLCSGKKVGLISAVVMSQKPSAKNHCRVCGAHDSSHCFFSPSFQHPQGEYPINPSMFVQRRIGSFECQ